MLVRVVRVSSDETILTKFWLGFFDFFAFTLTLTILTTLTIKIDYDRWVPVFASVSALSFLMLSVCHGIQILLSFCGSFRNVAFMNPSQVVSR